MAALTVAKNNLVKGMAPMEGLLKDLLEREFITPDAYDRVKADEDFAHYFKPKAKAKKPPKTPKIASKEEKNREKFDECRCLSTQVGT